MEINKENGIRNIVSEEILTKINLLNYFGNNLPSSVYVGSENKVNINTNEIKQNAISRNDTGNIISYQDTSKNKEKLNIIQLTKRFDTNNLKYSIDFQFKEFFSQENIIESLNKQIQSLKDDVDFLMGQLKGKDGVIKQLQDSDLEKQKQLEEAQKVIDDISKQAIEIADKLAKEMQDASKSSTDAITKLTEELSKQIDSLRKDLDKEKEKSALEKLNEAKKQADEAKSKDGVSIKESGLKDTISVNDFNNNLFDFNGNAITLTQPTTTQKEISTDNKTSTNLIKIDSNVLLFGNTISTALKSLESKVNANKASTEPPINETQKRGDSVLTKTNELLVEIAIGQWYKYHKKDGMYGDLFTRRDKLNLLRLKNQSKDENGTFIGQAVNNLSDNDITNLLKLFETYWKTIPYTDGYSKGLPYSKEEQEEFEKIYPIFKGVTQYKTPPVHFLYFVYIFSDSSIRNNRYSYVKF